MPPNQSCFEPGKSRCNYNPFRGFACLSAPMNSKLTFVSFRASRSAWDLDLDGPPCPPGSFPSLLCCSLDRSLCPGNRTTSSKWSVVKDARSSGGLYGGAANRGPISRRPATHHHEFGPTLRGMTSPSLTQPAPERGLPTSIGRRPLHQDRCSGGRGRFGLCTLGSLLQV